MKEQEDSGWQRQIGFHQTLGLRSRDQLLMSGMDLSYDNEL